MRRTIPLLTFGGGGMPLMPAYLWVVLVATLLATCVLLGGWSEPAKAAFPGGNGKIVFVEYAYFEDDPDHLWTVNPDGSGLKKITDSAGFSAAWDPEFSPDGKKLAFRGIAEDPDTGNFIVDIYTANADGTRPKNVTDDPAGDQSPTWSPNGNKIAFGSSRNATASNPSDVYVTNADGTGALKRITNRPDSEDGLAWSPDGTKLLFSSPSSTTAFPNPGRDDEIYAMNPDGSGVSRLTNNKAWDRTANWSPDAKKIAYVKDPQDGESAIHTMNPDGSGKTKISVDPPEEDFRVFLGDYGPAWSPDGRKIAFERLWRETFESELIGEIYTMNADGARVKVLASSGAGIIRANPDWGPR